MNENENAVDFNNPDSIASELAAAEVATPAKKAKVKKPRVIKVTFTADKDIAAGETVTFDYTMPVGSSRGAVSGIPLEDMDDEQLKIEYRNANSVAYKTRKAGHDATKAEARLDRCKAEMEKRGIQPSARASAAVDAKAVAALISSGKISVDEIQKFLDDAQ